MSDVTSGRDAIAAVECWLEKRVDAVDESLVNLDVDWRQRHALAVDEQLVDERCRHAAIQICKV